MTCDGTSRRAERWSWQLAVSDCACQHPIPREVGDRRAEASFPASAAGTSLFLNARATVISIAPALPGANTSVGILERLPPSPSEGAHAGPAAKTALSMWESDAVAKDNSQICRAYNSRVRAWRLTRSACRSRREAPCGSRSREAPTPCGKSPGDSIPPGTVEGTSPDPRLSIHPRPHGTRLREARSRTSHSC